MVRKLLSAVLLLDVLFCPVLCAWEGDCCGQDLSRRPSAARCPHCTQTPIAPEHPVTPSPEHGCRDCFCKGAILPSHGAHGVSEPAGRLALAADLLPDPILIPSSNGDHDERIHAIAPYPFGGGNAQILLCCWRC